MGKSLKMRAVAEGGETSEQFEFLQNTAARKTAILFGPSDARP
jgi:sensor c-di-GMP phosphodiesterase-like protein